MPNCQTGHPQCFSVRIVGLHQMCENMSLPVRILVKLLGMITSLVLYIFFFFFLPSASWLTYCYCWHFLTYYLDQNAVCWFHIQNNLHYKTDWKTFWAWLDIEYSWIPLIHLFFLLQQATISIFVAWNWFSVFGAAQRVVFLSHTHIYILLHHKYFTWAGQPGVLTAANLVTYFRISYFFICIGLTGGQSASLNLLYLLCTYT